MLVLPRFPAAPPLMVGLFCGSLGWADGAPPLMLFLTPPAIDERAALSASSVAVGLSPTFGKLLMT